VSLKRSSGREEADGIRDIGIALKNAFNLRQIHTVSPNLDLVIAATHKGDVSRAFHPPEIPGAIIPPRQVHAMPIVGRFQAIEIAQHDLGTLNTDLSLDTGPDLLAAVIEEQHCHSFCRRSDV
jgi:hypothetical protein